MYKENDHNDYETLSYLIGFDHIMITDNDFLYRIITKLLRY